MPVPVLVKTVTVLSPELAVIRSSFPSPFTSAATTEFGAGPTAKVAARTNPPLPLLVSTVTVLSEVLALIKSTSPSPFTSAAATENGAFPTPGVEATANTPRPLPVQPIIPWLFRRNKLTFVRLAPFPEKAPVRVTPPAPLVSTAAGNWPSPSTPVNRPAVTFRFVNPPPSPAKTEFVMNAFVMAMPAITLLASPAVAAVPAEVAVVALPRNVPLKVTPAAPLVSTPSGSEALPVPENWDAFRLVRPLPSPCKTPAR